MKTNIVIINDFDYVQGGASKVAIDTANALSNLSDKYNVYFFSGDSNESSTLNEKIIKICTNQGEAIKSRNKIKGFVNGIYNLKARKELKRLLKTLEPKKTVIHIHGWTKCLSSSVFSLTHKMKFKVVLTAHDYFPVCPNGGLFNYKTTKICNYKPMSLNCIKCHCDSRNYFFKLYRLIRQIVQNYNIKKINNIITISDFSEKIIKKYMKKNINYYRVYNPIDIKTDDSLIVEKNKYIYIGRVSKEKGVELFCHALTDLNLPGIVVGDGPLLDELKEKYKKIKFLGWKTHDQAINILKSSKALIFPSLWYETAGLTTIEAQMLGIPCIVSRNSASSEFIEDGITGLLFDGLDELKEKIITFEKTNINLEKETTNKYNEEIYRTNLIHVYEEVLYNK